MADDSMNAALDRIGKQAQAEGACSICWASVLPYLRNRHLDWHASQAREAQRDRLPTVYGGPPYPPVEQTGSACASPDGGTTRADPLARPVCDASLSNDLPYPPEQHGAQE